MGGHTKTDAVETLRRIDLHPPRDPQIAIVAGPPSATDDARPAGSLGRRPPPAVAGRIHQPRRAIAPRREVAGRRPTAPSQAEVRPHGSPRIRLVDETALILIEFRAKTPEGAQQRAAALITALQRQLDNLRNDEVDRRAQSIRQNLKVYEDSVNPARTPLRRPRITRAAPTPPPTHHNHHHHPRKRPVGSVSLFCNAGHTPPPPYLGGSALRVGPHHRHPGQCARD